MDPERQAGGPQRQQFVGRPAHLAMAPGFRSWAMGRETFRALRGARRLLLRGAGVVELTANRLGGRRPYPPLHLRREITRDLSGLDFSAGEWAAYASLLGGLTPAAHVLDVGCGVGMVAMALADRLGPYGRYLGVDVDRAMIRWCQSHLGSDRFSFARHDYWNATYNPAGERRRSLDVDDGWADLVLMKSVLTHMLPDDVVFYLHEAARVMRPGGRAVVSAFLYGKEDQDSAAEIFPVRGGGYLAMMARSPESGLALPRQWFEATIADAGLSADLHLGRWRGADVAGLSFQDLVVLTLGPSGK